MNSIGMLFLLFPDKHMPTTKAMSFPIDIILHIEAK
jgi:hypothetical protein